MRVDGFKMAVRLKCDLKLDAGAVDFLCDSAYDKVYTILQRLISGLVRLSFGTQVLGCEIAQSKVLFQLILLCHVKFAVCVSA